MDVTKVRDVDCNKKVRAVYGVLGSPYSGRTRSPTAPCDSNPHRRSIRKASPNPLAPPTGSNKPEIASRGSVVGAPSADTAHVGGIASPAAAARRIFPSQLRWLPCRGRSESDRGWNRYCDWIVADNTLGSARRRHQWPRVAHHNTNATRLSGINRIFSGSTEMKAVSDGDDAGSKLPSLVDRDRHRLSASELPEYMSSIKHDCAIAIRYDCALGATRD